MRPDASSTVEIESEVKGAVGASIVLGVLMVIVGIAAVAFPFAATLASTLFIGSILIIHGAVSVGYALQSRPRRGLILKLLVGILSIGTGILLLINPFEGALALTLVLGIFLLVEGIIETALAGRLRPSSGWGWVLFDGILTIILGLLISLQWPSTALWALGLLVGLSIISSGVTRIMVALHARKLIGQFDALHTLRGST